MFKPEVLNPTPEPWLVKAIKEVDPALRVVWGYQRYFLDRWVIERKISPERYNRMYKSLLESGEPRFIDQPIFNSDQPIYNAEGEYVGDTIIGYRKFDLAPEWECVLIVQNSDGSYRPLDSRTLVLIRQTYAEERFRSLEHERLAREAISVNREQAQRERSVEIGLEAADEAYRQLGKKIQI